MKTIQVSDEVYEFLKSCQEELNKQDNRCTNNPIFGFMIKQKHASYDPQEFDFVNEDHTERITDTERENWEEELAEYVIAMYDDRSMEEIREILSGLFTDVAFPVYHQYSNDEEFEKALKHDLAQYLKNLDYWDMDDFCDTINIKKYGYQKDEEMYQESVSLFESDMQAHLDTNKHNMKDYKTYVFYIHRTPKMEKLREVLMKELKFKED
jgi:hypothetical protein